MKKLTMDKLRLRISMALAGFGIICIVSPILLGQTSLLRYNTPSAQHFKNADEKLDASYRRLYSMCDDRGKERLEVTQKVWSRFRDAQSKFESSQASTPQDQAAAFAQAHERLTQLRIASINSQIGELQRTKSSNASGASLAPSCESDHSCASHETSSR